MPGIIQQQMPPQPGGDPSQGGGDPSQMPPQPGGDPSQGGAPQPGQQMDLSPQGVRGQMQMPPQLQQAYERVVAAGMKVMFDPKTHGQMVQVLQQPGPLDQKIAQGIAGLLMLLWKESNGSIPPKVLIPAGIELAMHAVDFLKKAGQQVSDQDVAQGVSEMINIVLQKFGINPDKLSANIDAAGSQGQQQAPPEPDDGDQNAQGAEPPGDAVDPQAPPGPPMNR